MSAWTHLLCGACWNAEHPDRPAERNPVFRETHEGPPCCACGKPTSSGIHTREDPSKMHCKGAGPEHES